MLLSMFDVEGFILVGGQSTRMGRDKSQLVFGAQTGVDRIAKALRTLTPTVRLVGNRGDHPGFDNIPDTFERWGALGGIHAALEAGKSEWALIAACDLPLVTAALFARLWQFALGGRDAFDAIVPIQPDERPQPLCAIYRRQACLSAASSLIALDEHKPRALLASVRTRWVQFAEISDLPGATDFFLNVNTPNDYEQAASILAQPKSEDG
ncbi:MAG: molybdenum cofactor guanylyltransferase [Blastocatellia bacterium]|nr:molybdenum cofactor guanylyltransferase [Blastocatellia bacterium]